MVPVYIGRRRSVLDGARIRAYTVSPSADERRYYTVHSVRILQCITYIQTRIISVDLWALGGRKQYPNCAIIIIYIIIAVSDQSYIINYYIKRSGAFSRARNASQRPKSLRVYYIALLVVIPIILQDLRVPRRIWCIIYTARRIRSNELDREPNGSINIRREIILLIII